jgi:hypothetical protein
MHCGFKCQFQTVRNAMWAEIGRSARPSFHEGRPHFPLFVPAEPKPSGEEPQSGKA